MRSPASELVVHEDALRDNTARFHALTGGRLMAVLKADAFGHGDIASSVLESGAGSIGVTSIDEALALRRAGVDAPILSWLNTPDADVESALRARIDLAVPHLELLSVIAGAARATGIRARLHLHIDVGTGRDGCPPREWATLCAFARAQEAVGALIVVGVMGHLSCADDPRNEQNVRERLVFENAIRTARRRGLRPHLLHLAATAATLTGTAAGYDLHRIGAGLFGIDPSRTIDDLRPALTLTSTVVSSREARRAPASATATTSSPHPARAWRCCRSATPTGSRARPRGGQRCWCVASDDRWWAGSRWTWWSSTPATCCCGPASASRSSVPAGTGSRPSPSGPPGRARSSTRS